jgi:predicted nucleotidyltransferase
VRSARESAQMSARALASASEVSTSTVTRIERGQINPTVQMLDRLLTATGNSLSMTVHPSSREPTLSDLRKHRTKVLDVVSSFDGSNVRVFGSVARGEATENSDVDLLIDVPAGTGLFTVEAIAEALERVLPWKVDLMTSGAAHHRMAHVLDEAVVL